MSLLSFWGLKLIVAYAVNGGKALRFY